MSTEATWTRKPSVLASATRKPTPQSVRTHLWFALLSAALFGGCGAAPESFEDEGGREDVATATDELQRGDDLSNLAEEEIAMEPAGPMVERVDQENWSNYTLCTANCSKQFEFDIGKLDACYGFCQCVYDNNGKNLVTCTMEFTDRLARL